MTDKNSNEIKIIALDLDGTLLDSRKMLSDKNKRALFRAADLGIHVVPTTGRFYSAIPDFIRELPFIRYVVGINGAEVARVDTGEVIYSAEIPVEQAVSIMDMLDGVDCIYDCYRGGKAWMTRSLWDVTERYAPDKYYTQMIRDLRRPVDDLKRFLLQSPDVNVQKISAYLKNVECRNDLLRKIEDLFPDTAASYAVVNNIEINHSDANKGSALNALAEYLGYGSENVMAVGDGLNDLSMIKRAGVGVAMANSIPQVLEAADFITSDNDSDGVAAAIDHFIM